MAREHAVIEVRLRELAQIFNSFDPSPFHERDLDSDAEEYIVGWARELPADVPLRIIVHLPKDEARKAEERGLSTALVHYFAYRAAMQQRELNELFHNGRRYLVIGILVLAACLIGSQMARKYLGSGPMASLITESLILVGWVANWKPIETFLYSWWPLKRWRDLYRRLADAVIEIKSD
ncbi:hypothetical protein [Hyphomicrobium sp.]|uniref:hypothetical protein n=1 Tax=Hyphomicrobium sp. TaxID=82 RepID=UPI002D795B1D|nr:hypothetical protein [Hyphomicrobium sp.]HET6391019.1 hypothetical protein [Hyphomicrobium sp.]